MRTHETTTGEGDAPITCRYDFDDDGDLEELQVIYGGIDIVDALSEPQLDEIERECRSAAKTEYEESRYDTAISNYIEEMTA